MTSPQRKYHITFPEGTYDTVLHMPTLDFGELLGFLALITETPDTLSSLDDGQIEDLLRIIQSLQQAAKEAID